MGDLKPDKGGEQATNKRTNKHVDALPQRSCSTGRLWRQRCSTQVHRMMRFGQRLLFVLFRDLPACTITQVNPAEPVLCKLTEASPDTRGPA